MLSMKTAAATLFVTAIAAATFVDARGAAQAQWGWTPSPYPWCAHVAAPLGGYQECSYVALEQCRATISGVGGRCYENPAYVGPPPQYRAARKHRRHAR
jgi:hypothetical protein